MSSKRVPTTSIVQRDGQTVGGQRDGQTVGGQRDGQTVGGQRDGQTVGGQRDGQTVGGQRDGQTVGGQRDGQTSTLGSPGYDIREEGYPDQEEEEKLMDRGHPILVRTLPSEKDLSLKLLKYFGSNSKSGGGECDVTRVDGQTYCAIFQNQDDQRRVLGRGNHIIEITVPVTVQDIGREDLARIRRLSGDEERMKVLQQLAVSAGNSAPRLPDAQISPHTSVTEQTLLSLDAADQVCFPSALYEYIMEIYRTEIDKLEKRYGVKIVHRSTLEGCTYVRFISQGSDSSPEKAKEKLTDKILKAMDDWTQVTMDSSVVLLKFSDIKERVTNRWSNTQVIQGKNKDIILRGPKDELSQVKTFLEKGDHKSADHKPARPRRAVTISTSNMGTDIPVDVRHMDILKKLKYREISDIEKNYNVKMEERRKNGSSLVTFKSVNASPDLSPHASHSFITLLQKTFFNIERKEISVKPEFPEERVSLVQEQLMMSGIDLVMEYSKGSVLLIGDPVHVAFAEEKLHCK